MRRTRVAIEPKIASKNAFVVGFRITVKPLDPEIPALWQKFALQIGEFRSIVEPRVRYGLMGNFSPATNQFEYMAGVPVSAGEPLPDGMVIGRVPANTHAVFDATLAGVGNAFGYIGGNWRQSARHRQSADPYFER